MGVAVMGENAFEAADAEHERRRLLGEMDAEYGPDWSQLNGPGSFGCHELLDRTSLIGDLVEESLLNHPACVGNPEWFAMASQAVELLRELYQRIGQDHPEPLRVPNREAVGGPRGGQGPPETQFQS
jgi:hypothetical protein